jgi:hypothetical protein
MAVVITQQQLAQLSDQNIERLLGEGA